MSVESTGVPVTVALGRSLRDARLLRGLSLEELAHELGVSHQQVAKYERGVDRPNLERLHIAARVLGEDLYAWIGDALRAVQTPPLVTITPIDRVRTRIARRLYVLAPEQVAEIDRYIDWLLARDRAERRRGAA